MIASSHCIPSTNDSVSYEGDFVEKVVPKLESSAAWWFRRLPEFEREEAVASAVALAWSMYRALVLRGKEPLKFCSRFVACVVFRVCEGRQLGCSVNSADILSRAARRQHGIVVESLFADGRTAPGTWRGIVVEDRSAGPAETAAARLDIAEWLSRMSPRRRQIAECLGSGDRPMDVAREFRLSRGRISQLRQEFRKSWAAFQGE